MKIAIVYDSLVYGSINVEENEIYKHRQDIKNDVQKVIEDIGHITTLIEANDNIIEQLRNKKVDIVFNISCTGPGGCRHALVPLILDWLGIPYTGSGPLAHMVALDKPTAKRVFKAFNIQTPRFQVASHSDEIDLDINYPLFVKPVVGGCSLGVADDSLVHTKSQLREIVEKIITVYNQPALIEEYVDGREFTVGILGNDNPIVLPILEFDFENTIQKKFRTFETKMVQQNVITSICPAQLSIDYIHHIQETAIAAYRAVGCYDFARIDIRLDTQGRAQVLEVNSLPGLAQGFGSFTQMAQIGGMTYPNMIEAIFMYACMRYKLS